MTKPLRFSLKELAQITKSKLAESFDVSISGIADLESASKDDISFLSNPRYEKQLNSSKAAAIIVSPNTELDSSKNYLINENPSFAFQTIIELFSANLGPRSGFEGIHSSAVIHPSVTLKKTTHVGPNAVIDEGCQIGDHVHIGAQVYIGKGCIVGNSVTLHPNVTIREYCQVGNKVTIQPGAVIGSCGFGFLTNASGEHAKLKQLGNVILEDDVEIGANATIDRARFTSTIIGQGSKVDNLVQIAHGVTMGKHNLIVAQTGISGSTHLGNHVVLGGQTGVVGHIKISDFVQAAAKSGITKSLTKPGGYRGNPTLPINDFQRKEVLLRNIHKLKARVDALEKILEQRKDEKNESSKTE